jgi:hypothetical protein
MFGLEIDVEYREDIKLMEDVIRDVNEPDEGGEESE